MTTNIFGGTGKWVNYTNKFNCPHIPARMRNAISAELNARYIGAESILPVPAGVNCEELIPNWLIFLWAEMGLLIKLSNVGVGTYNETLQVIAACLSE